MKVKAAEVSEGIHPSEVVVAVSTTDGIENIVVSRRSFKSGGIDIGFPIRQDRDQYLIELPRETLSGSWRVWVKADQLIEEERLRA
ncbi:MAG: hypothetical protein WAK03_08265 [Methylocystis sp.]